MTIQYFSLFLVLAAMGNQFRILQLVHTESKGVPATRWKNTVTPSGIVTGSTGSPLVLPGPIFRLLDLLLDTACHGVHPCSPSSLNFTPATPLLVKHSTINLSLTSEESLTDSKLPDTGYLRTKGQESVYESCACVIHTILLSYMCINIVSHFTLMFARGTCAS